MTVAASIPNNENNSRNVCSFVLPNTFFAFIKRESIFSLCFFSLSLLLHSEFSNFISISVACTRTSCIRTSNTTPYSVHKQYIQIKMNSCKYRCLSTIVVFNVQSLLLLFLSSFLFFSFAHVCIPMGCYLNA